MEKKNHDAEGKRTEKVGKASQQISKSTQISNISQSERNIEEEILKREKELERVNDEKCQQRKKNLLFKKKIANLEHQLDALQKQLKDNKLKAEMPKLPNTANKSTHASSTINDKMVVSKSTQAKFAYADNASQNNSPSADSIDSKLEKFTTDILDTVTKIVDEKLNLLGNHVQYRGN